MILHVFSKPGRKSNFHTLNLWVLSQKLHSAAAKDLKRRGYAYNRPALLLQVRHGTRPGGAHVQISQVHFRAAATRRSCITWKDTRLW